MQLCNAEEKYVLLWMLAHMHDRLSSVTPIVMRNIYPLGSLKKTQSIWLLMSQCSIRELEDLTETEDNQEPERIRLYKPINLQLQLLSTSTYLPVLQGIQPSKQ